MNNVTSFSRKQSRLRCVKALMPVIAGCTALRYTWVTVVSECMTDEKPLSKINAVL